MSSGKSESPVARTAELSNGKGHINSAPTVAHMCGRGQLMDRPSLPRALSSIREAHEDDTADELTLCDAIAARRVLAGQIEADRRITWSEWRRLCGLDRVIEECALKSLNNNRRINSMYSQMYARRDRTFDADARAQCPEIGTITIGEILRSTDWLDHDAA